MEATATKATRRVKHNMLRKNEELFVSKKKSNPAWLTKLQSALDMEVVEIVQTGSRIKL